MNPKFVPFVKELLELEKKHGVTVTYIGNCCDCDVIVEDAEDDSDYNTFEEVCEEMKKME